MFLGTLIKNLASISLNDKHQHSALHTQQ